MEDETVDDDRRYGGRPVTVEEHDALVRKVSDLETRLDEALEMLDEVPKAARKHMPAVDPVRARFTNEEGWTHSVYRSATGIGIEARASGRPTLMLNMSEATARWLGGRILAALDLPPQETTTKVAEEPTH